MDITFTKNNTAAEIGDIIVRAFPSLAGNDLSRVELITSYERGHAMKKVATGMQDGEKIMSLFGGSRKKKIFLLLPNTATTTSAATQPPTSTSSSATQATHSITQPPISGSSAKPPVTQSAISASLSTALQAMQPAISSSSSTASPGLQPSLSTAPIAIQPHTSTSLSTPPVIHSSLLTSLPAPPAALQSAILIPDTPSSSSALVTKAMPSTTSTPTTSTAPQRTGASTRRHLTAMASAAGVTFDDGSESTDSDQSQYDDQKTNRPMAISSDSEHDTDVLIGEAEAPSLYGYVTDDLSTAGVVTDETVSRTTEVLKCIEVLEEGRQDATLPFLAHTFEEFTWQGTEDLKVMVAVLLPFNCPIPFKRRLVSLLNNVAQPNCYLWITHHKSTHADKVKVKYGLNNPKSCILVLAPCHSRNMPQCVEIFNESDLQGDKLQESILRAQDLCNAMKDERRKLEEWRQVRLEQDTCIQFQETNWANSRDNTEDMGQENGHYKRKGKGKGKGKGEGADKDENKEDSMDKDNDQEKLKDKIRQERRKRVGSPPSGNKYSKIILRYCEDKKTGRRFRPDALFQEVYDWAGSLEDLPLHFTIQRRQQVVLHSDPLQGHEVLDVRQREEDEIRALLQSEVSFRGNLPPVQSNEGALSATLVDEQQKGIKEKAKDREEGEEKGVKDKEQVQIETEEETRQEEEEIEELAKKEEETGNGNEEEIEGAEGLEKEENREGQGKKRKPKKDKRTTAKRRKAKLVKDD